MNNGYTQYPAGSMIPQSTMSPIQNIQNNTQKVESYAGDILRDHIGQYAEVYASFADSNDWKNKIFKGLIKHVGRDYFCIEDQSSKKKYLVMMIYLDYVIF